jgi:predicted metal-dependent phosphoesterase TrpH
MKIKDQLHKQLTNLSKADLHIHSNFSDAYSSIEEILEYVQNKTDLSVIAITDHDTIMGLNMPLNWQKRRNIGLK